MSKDNKIGTLIRYWGIWAFFLCNTYGDKFECFIQCLAETMKAMNCFSGKEAKQNPQKPLYEDVPSFQFAHLATSRSLGMHRNKKNGG